MENFGFIIGAGLLGLVTLVAFALGYKAQASVEEFREDRHQRFEGRGDR